MKKLDNTEKSILFGVASAIVIGIVTAIFLNDDVQKKTKAVVNRQKAKYYVRDKFNGSSRASSVVDKLSDDEVNTLLGTVDKVNDLEKKLSNVTSDVKDYISDKTKDTKKAVKKMKK